MSRLLSLFVCLGFAALSSVAHADHSWGSTALGATQAVHVEAWRQRFGSMETIPQCRVIRLGHHLVLDTVVVAGGAADASPPPGRSKCAAERYGYTAGSVSRRFGSAATISPKRSPSLTTITSMRQIQHPPVASAVTCREIGHTFGLDHQDEEFFEREFGQLHGLHVEPGPGSNERPIRMTSTSWCSSTSMSTVRPAPLRQARRACRPQ